MILACRRYSRLRLYQINNVVIKTGVRMSLRLLLLGAFSAAMATTAAVPALAAPRGFTVEDMVAMERVGHPVLSPDATRVVYTVRSTNLDKNRGNTQLWLIDLRAPNAAPRQLTRGESSASDPEWSPNGDVIYFLSGRSGSSQVWQLPLNGGEASKVTDLPLDVDTFRLSPQGDRLAFSMGVFLDCADIACTKKRLDEKAKNKASGMVYDQLFVRHWDTWADGRRNVLYSAPIDTSGRVSATPVSLSGTLDGDTPSKPFGDNGEYHFSPDGKTVAFSVRVGGRTESWSTNFDVYTVPAIGGQAPRNLTPENPAWDARATYSPDGRTLAYVAMTKPGFEADRFHLVLMDVATGKKHTLADDWDRSIADYSWAPDGKSLLVSADDVGQHRLFAMDAASGKVTPISGPGTVAAFDAKHDTLILEQASLSSGAQLFKTKLGADASKATQLTHLNEQALADVRFGESEQFS